VPGTLIGLTLAAELASALSEEVERGRVCDLSVPTLLASVRDALNDPRTKVSDVSRLVVSRANLERALLLVADQTRSGSTSAPPDIERALGIIGPEVLLAVIAAVELTDVAPCSESSLAQQVRDRHRRAAYAAPVARALVGRADGIGNDGFTAGLLHVSGEVALLGAIDRGLLSGVLERSAESELGEAVRRVGPLAGSRLLAEWGFPDSIVAAVAWQDDSQRSPSRWRISAASVAIAAAAADCVLHGGPSHRERHDALRDLICSAPSPLRGWSFDSLLAIARSRGAELHRALHPGSIVA
jgi:HD-like signal output (HDOD) protein